MDRCQHCTYISVPTASVPTYAITSISKVAQTTGAIKGPLGVNAVSIHMAIMAVVQIALIDI